MKPALTTVKPRRRPTWLGWLLLSIPLLAFLATATANLYPLLAPQQPMSEGIMVVEGWINDDALDAAIALFHAGSHPQIACTGTPIETGSYLQAFHSYPEMTAARLAKKGVPPEKILVAVAPDATKDRTYQSARALRALLHDRGIAEKRLHLVSVGAHGRRSRMLFQKALGREYEIGVTSLPPSSYAPREWRRCSEGVREVVGEGLAYLYAKFLFHPGTP